MDKPDQAEGLGLADKPALLFQHCTLSLSYMYICVSCRFLISGTTPASKGVLARFDIDSITRRH